MFANTRLMSVLPHGGKSRPRRARIGIRQRARRRAEGRPWSGSGPKTPRSRRGSAPRSAARTACACRRAPPRSRAARAPAPTGCPCGRPRKNQAECAVPATGIVRRPVVPMPWPSGVPSWNSRFGAWQVAHETWPLPLSRVSKKSSRPSAAARGSSAWRLVGSGRSESRLASVSERSSCRSAADQRGARALAVVAATAPVAAASTAAARAARACDRRRNVADRSDRTCGMWDMARRVDELVGMPLYDGWSVRSAERRAQSAARPVQSFRLNTTESRPGAASMPNFTTHQPPMLNFIPSTT